MKVSANSEKGRGYIRYERKLQILALLHVAMINYTIGESQKCGLTVYQMAHELKIAPSQHLRLIVKELVKQNIVYEDNQKYRGAFNRVVYCIVDAEMWTSEYGDGLAVYFENFQDKVLL